jgi:hypothetical protein
MLIAFRLDAKCRTVTDPVEQLERGEAMEPFDRLRAGLWNDWNTLANLNERNVLNVWNGLEPSEIKLKEVDRVAR